jgi:spore germination protein GerM
MLDFGCPRNACPVPRQVKDGRPPAANAAHIRINAAERGDGTRRDSSIRQREVQQPTVGRVRRLALVLVLPAALVLSGCVATPEGGITNSSSPSELIPVPASGAPTTSAPLETAQTSNKAPVYWIGRSNDNAFLYREFRDVPDQENPVTRALRVMMSQKPLDPDFFTPWQNPKKLATSISGKNVITVDVSADAFNSNVDAAMAERAIQQLVYTATAAAASAGLIDSGQQVQVVVLVDSHTDYVAFDHVRLGAPTSRSAGMVAPVWIIDPQEGASVADGSVKISGRSTVQGGKLHWEILKVDGDNAKTAYLNGNATASADSTQSGLFTLSANLGPGRYEVRVAQVDASSDSAKELFFDTRGFTVK